MRSLRISISAWALCAAACASAPPPPPPAEAVAQPTPIQEAVAEARAAAVVEDVSPVGRGELPWWHLVSPGAYRFRGRVVVLARGASVDHHHVAEGFLHARVSARLAVRRAAEGIAFPGTMPEPEMLDLFVTRDRQFLTLYELKVPADAQVRAIQELDLPQMLNAHGRRRIGRHVYEGPRHLFLECEVEGPIANPDWGRNRASARVVPQKRAPGISDRS